MIEIERLKKLAAADSTPEEIRKELIDILSTPPQMWPNTAVIKSLPPRLNGTIWCNAPTVPTEEIKISY